MDLCCDLGPSAIRKLSQRERVVVVSSTGCSMSSGSLSETHDNKGLLWSLTAKHSHFTFLDPQLLGLLSDEGLAPFCFRTPLRIPRGWGYLNALLATEELLERDLDLVVERFVVITSRKARRPFS